MKKCIPCIDNGEDRKATHIGKQSIDCGKTITEVPICASHACGWTDGCDWKCPKPKKIK